MNEIIVTGTAVGPVGTRLEMPIWYGQRESESTWSSDWASRGVNHAVRQAGQPEQTTWRATIISRFGLTSQDVVTNVTTPSGQQLSARRNVTCPR